MVAHAVTAMNFRTLRHASAVTLCSVIANSHVYAMTHGDGGLAKAP
jgi:hypothetical protein